MMHWNAKRRAATLSGHAATIAATLVLLLTVFAPGAANAQVTCTFSIPNLSFGTINPYSGFPYSTGGDAAETCTNNGSSSTTLYECYSIGTGSGGTTAANRTLAMGAAKIPIQIFTSGNSTQTGDGTAYAMDGVYASNLAANGQQYSTTSISVTMPAPGSPPAPGTYSSNFSGASTALLYTSGSSGPSTCSALAAGAHSTAQGNFTISATVATQCTVSATSLAFPTASVLASAVSATATISVTCNASTPVTVALDNGATGTGPTARRMKSGANVITYGIYRDSGATMPWGQTSGTNTASLPSGTGTLTAYGRVPAQASPAPGSYSDVVNVTLTY